MEGTKTTTVTTQEAITHNKFTHDHESRSQDQKTRKNEFGKLLAVFDIDVLSKAAFILLFVWERHEHWAGPVAAGSAPPLTVEFCEEQLRLDGQLYQEIREGNYENVLRWSIRHRASTKFALPSVPEAYATFSPLAC